MASAPVAEPIGPNEQAVGSAQNPAFDANPSLNEAFGPSPEELQNQFDIVDPSVPAPPVPEVQEPPPQAPGGLGEDALPSSSPPAPEVAGVEPPPQTAPAAPGLGDEAATAAPDPTVMQWAKDMGLPDNIAQGLGDEGIREMRAARDREIAAISGVGRPPPPQQPWGQPPQMKPPPPVAPVDAPLAPGQPSPAALEPLKLDIPEDEMDSGVRRRLEAQINDQQSRMMEAVAARANQRDQERDQAFQYQQSQLAEQRRAQVDGMVDGFIARECTGLTAQLGVGPRAGLVPGSPQWAGRDQLTVMADVIASTYTSRGQPVPQEQCLMRARNACYGEEIKRNAQQELVTAVNQTAKLATLRPAGTGTPAKSVHDRCMEIQEQYFGTGNQFG